MFLILIFTILKVQEHQLQPQEFMNAITNYVQLPKFDTTYSFVMDDIIVKSNLSFYSENLEPTCCCFR